MYNEKTRIRFSHEFFKSSSLCSVRQNIEYHTDSFHEGFITVKHIFESVTDRKA